MSLKRHCMMRESLLPRVQLLKCTLGLSYPVPPLQFINAAYSSWLTISNLYTDTVK